MDDGVIMASLNEVESLATKAARGAGLGWGQAEDVGRAARWLAERDLDWAEALRRLFGSAPARLRLATAFHLADRVAGGQAGGFWNGAACDIVWTIPLLAQATRGQSFTLTLRGADIVVRLRPGGQVSADGPHLLGLPPQDVTVALEADGEPLAVEVSPKTRRSHVAAAPWRDLEALAARTYVPASTQSRARAGASESDND